MVNEELQKQVIALKTKVDILSWIGILPEPYGITSKLQIQMFIDCFTKSDVPDDIMQFITSALKSMTRNMNEGIHHVISFIDTSDRDNCGECNKCDDLSDILHMLLDNNKPIEEIQKTIQETLGSINDEDAPDYKNSPLELKSIPLRIPTGSPSMRRDHIIHMIDEIIESMMTSIQSDSGSKFDDFDLKGRNELVTHDKNKLH